MQPVNEKFKRVIFFEVCAGSAKLSYSVHSKGIHAIAVDWIRNRHESWHPIVKIDLTNADQTQSLLDFLDDDEVCCILFFALPCGTCSRAREIKLPNQTSLPQQLRSEQFPRGLPHVSARDKEKLDKANLVYDHCTVIILKA